MSEAPKSSAPAKLLIVTASVGAGHNSASAALIATLRSAAPQIRIDCIDTMDFVPRWFRAYYAGGFMLAMSRLPRLYGLGYRLTDRPQTAISARLERVRLWHEQHVCRALVERINQIGPDLVLHTHFLCAGVMGELIEAGRLNLPQWVVVTDVRVHRFWHAKHVEEWFVPCEPSRWPLLRWGVEPQRIVVSGIPIHAKWLAAVNRQEVLREWDLPANRPIVLISAGAQYTVGPIHEMVNGLCRACPEAFFVVLAGHNKKLLARLAQTPHWPGRIRGVGFTDRINELADVASLIVTKPGGITTAECLAKGTPMVLIRPVPGQEAGNAAFLAHHGAAVIARDADDLVKTVGLLLAQPALRAEMSNRARGLYRPATETITQAVHRRLGEQQGCGRSGRTGGSLIGGTRLDMYTD